MSERNRETGDAFLSASTDIRRSFQEHALPVLKKLLVDGGPVPVLRETLLAIGAVSDGDVWTNIDLEVYARHFLRLSEPELRMASMLALGIQGNPAAEPLLASLLRDDSTGRELVAGPVTELDRAFAALSLGMIGRENPDMRRRRGIAGVLVEALEEAPWQVQVACALALSHLPLDPCEGRTADDLSRHVCQETELRVLGELALNEEAHPWLRAHAACAIGRLAADAAPEQRESVAENLSCLLDPDTRVPMELRQGAVIGLGLLVDGRGAGDSVDSTARQRLLALTRGSDLMSRAFSLIALAEMASHRALSKEEAVKLRDLFAGELFRGRKSQRGWAALALGVLGHQSPIADAEIASVLRHSLTNAKDPSDSAAIAIALALVGADGSETGAALMSQYERFQEPAFRQHVSLALGILGVQEARPLLEREFAANAWAAIPLRLLGDATVVPRLVRRIETERGNLPKTIEAVRALGQTGAPEAIPALAEIVGNDQNDPALRAEAVASLGELADQDPYPWNAIYANDLQYQLLTWALKSPSKSGLGILDDRVVAVR